MNYNILIVDDDSLNLKLVSLILSKNGFNIQTASNGAEGLEILKNSKTDFDLVISDILMPVMDGFEFYKEIQKDSKLNKIPFIFMSGAKTEEEVKENPIFNSVGFISKPFTSSNLINKINEFIQKDTRNLITI